MKVWSLKEVTQYRSIFCVSIVDVAKLKYKRYSCLATEDMESDRSDSVHINPLCNHLNVFITFNLEQYDK